MTKAKAAAMAASRKGKRPSIEDILLASIDPKTLPKGLRPGDKVGPRTAPDPTLLVCGNG